MHAIPLELIIPLEEYTDEIKSQYRGRPLDLSYLKMLLLVDGTTLPPITVVPVEGGYVLLDGNHRVERARMKGEKEIQAEFVDSASIPELIKRAYLANQKHGLPDKLSRRVDFALWLIAAEHMSVREAAAVAQVAPSSITRRKQKIKEQEVEEKPVEDERLKPLKRLFKAVAGLQDYDDTNMFEDLRMCLGGVTEGVEDLHECIIDLVGAFITCTGESPWHS
jgi:hypothetical protein